MGMGKVCSRCKEEKPDAEYYRHNAHAGRAPRVASQCKECTKQGARTAYDRRKEAETPEERTERLTRARERSREHNRRIRETVLAHYGGKCHCCGEGRYEFLALDHIDGGGNRHRRDNRIGNQAGWLLRKGLPDCFRVLCHNCNMALGFYGTCPHQRAE